ncbi:gastrula zinc finger protein xFG20-1-like [Anopheles coustani]|uniref:gastrula zinc finger protein xFG20-1-like n=1 Tax=Anopheles coustani TaxID=139045 RepID=UPI00265AA5B4|nr:gastrula zinc finger protein xFG20-1-like [Anopheles coustani]
MTAKTTKLREKCRFCLCSDDLLSFSEALNTAFDFEDVRHFTGIELAKDADIAVCNECCTAINESKNFRLTCLRNDSIFKKLMCLGNRSPTHNITVTCAAPKDEVKSEHDVITLDDSESDESASHLGQPVPDDKNNTFSHDGNQSIIEHRKTDTYEQSGYGSDTDGHFGKLDGNDSDYSMPSLYDEAIHKPSNDGDMQQSLNAESMIGTKTEKSADCATDDYIEKAKTDCTCISRNKESSTNWSKRKRIDLDPNDSDDSITSLYTECNRKRSGPYFILTVCPVHASSSHETSLRRYHVLCHLCGAIVQSLKRHLEGSHNGEKTIACPHCPKKFKENYYLKVHINTWHERKIILTCSICGKGFVNEGSYSYHMTNKHVKSDVYECTTCKRKLKSWDGYKKHLKEHSLTALKCEDCGRLYKNMVTLEKHNLRYHSS